MKPSENTLVLGGCKSGKSRFAQKISEKLSPDRRLYIATCVPLDEEMKDRVARHRLDRDSSWTTVETPLDIARNIKEYSRTYGVILLDCLTLWVTNMLMEGMAQEAILEKVEELNAALESSACPVVVVSNEVGAGIVPESALARLFRDIQGIVNQRVAKAVDRVVVTLAGIPLTIKGKNLL